MLEKPEGQIPQHPKKSRWTVPYFDSLLTLSSEFDSGNLQSASTNVQLNQITITSGRDRDTKPSTKNWFYFSIEGDYQGTVQLVISKANILSSLSKGFDLYRPVVREEGGEWKRLPQPVEFRSAEGETNMVMKVEMNGRKVFVALIFPWSVSDNEQYLNTLDKVCRKDPSLYFNKQTLIYSYEKRPIHLIAITSSEISQNQEQQYLQHLFPERQSQVHFKTCSKPVIMITARVHPGQVGSSHAMNGMLELLTGSDELAVRLRKEFYFLIVPMLNPDGVENGNNRMDALGQNLNRFYHLPDITKQPSCYAIKLLVEHTRKSLYAFFDLHGHANRKSCFLYGNSISFLRLQAQSLLYAKLLSNICPQIDFQSCNFSKKQMSSKDKNEDMSKQGCARVVVHRWTNSPYCFTLETGLGKNIWVDDKGIERYSEELYTIGTYKRMGVGMLRVVDTILKGGKKLEETRAEMMVMASRLEKKEMKSEGGKGESRESREVKKKEKEKGVAVTTKEFKFDGTGLSPVVDGPPIPGKQNTKKQSLTIHHPHQSISSDKARQIQKILHQNKNYLLSLDNELRQDDD